MSFADTRLSVAVATAAPLEAAAALVTLVARLVVHDGVLLEVALLLKQLPTHLAQHLAAAGVPGGRVRYEGLHAGTRHLALGTA